MLNQQGGRRWGKVDGDEEEKEEVFAACRTGKDLSPPRTKSVSNCHCHCLLLLLLPVRAASSSTVLSELVVRQRQCYCCRARRDLKDEVGPDGRLSMAVRGKKNWRGAAQESEAEGAKVVAVAAGVVVVAEQMWMERRDGRGPRLRRRLVQRSRSREWRRRGRRYRLRNRPGRDRVERDRCLSVITWRCRGKQLEFVGSRCSLSGSSVSTGGKTDRPCISSSIGRG